MARRRQQDSVRPRWRPARLLRHLRRSGTDRPSRPVQPGPARRMPETPPSSIQTALLLPLTPGGGQAGQPNPGRARSQRSAAAGPPGVQGRTQLTDGRVGARQPRFVPPLRRVSRASQALDKSASPPPVAPKAGTSHVPSRLLNGGDDRPTRDVRPRGFLSRVAARSAQAARRSSSPSTALSAPGGRVRGYVRPRHALRAKVQQHSQFSDARARVVGIGGFPFEQAPSSERRRRRRRRVLMLVALMREQGE